jgi:L-fuculose-phosphate aldolase
MEPWREIARFSKKLYDKGYMVSHSGNLSIRVGDHFYIKRRGAAPDEMGPEDVIAMPMEGESGMIVVASTEAYVHRAIYKKTSHLAVVHAHPPYSIACSLLYDEILPLDEEGEYFLHKVPVLSVAKTSGSKELEEAVSDALKSYKGVIVRGHGTFAAAKLLEEAYHITCMIEATCQIRYLVDMTGRKPKREHVEFRRW